MENVFDILKARGFIEQTSGEEELRSLLANEKVTFYSGFDPTADSLTIGHYVPLMAIAHMQKAGHRPIILVGGGTGMVGDPTDKTDMRRVMTPEEVKHNCDCFKEQMAKFIDFSDGAALMADNADWLLSLSYVPFIRDYGVHFSVNKMLTAQAYKTRLEKGLTFFEFNYMLMQAYDFLELFRRYNCKLQMGGDDQWSNILAGADLIRRVEKADAHCMTFTLLTTGEGKKMGKTQQGAVWLDAAKTTPYEFYQYWRNVDDASVIKILKMLTFLPLSEIAELEKLEGGAINKAKEILAYELTKSIHGEQEAIQAQAAAKSLFGGARLDGSVPTTQIAAAAFSEGMNVIDLLEQAKIIATRGEGRRLIQQGGLKINEVKIESFDHAITKSDFTDGVLIIQKGKKGFHRVVL